MYESARGIAWYQRLVDPDIDRYLLHSRGEEVVAVIRRHGIAYARAVLEFLVALLAMYIYATGSDEVWISAWFGFGLLLHASWLALKEHMDRFVVTNLRVFRVTGVFNQKRATMPLSRILDITVTKPLLGRFCNYGHLIFESAAQEQGLREIRYVGSPDLREKEILDFWDIQTRSPAKRGAR